ncbi:MAG TPA: hypothetical protein VGB39_00565, partial [Sphingomicrobium sp.]
MSTETLEDYLAGDYHQDMDDIREIEETLEAVQNVFIHSHQDGRWPYERRAGKPADPPLRPSHGTQAMIAAALGKMTGQCTMPGNDLARVDFKLAALLPTAQKKGVECLIESIESATLKSGTFGDNDPVTLSHVAELIRGLDGAFERSTATKLWENIRGAEDALGMAIGLDPASSAELLPNLPDFQSDLRAPSQAPATARKPDYVTNAFVPLRIVRSAHSLAAAETSSPKTAASLPPLNGSQFDRYRKYFESTLYDQLSFSAIPDSRFDAAELIFCLEGLLLCGRQTVDDRVFEHV